MPEPIELEDLSIACKLGRSMSRERLQNGWVEKTGKKTKKWTGFWYEYVTVDGVEKRLPRSRVLGTCADLTKGTAQEKLHELIRGQKPPGSNATFLEMGNWYLRTRQGRWSQKMRKTMASIFAHQINPQLGGAIISKIKPSEVQQALDKIAADPKSQSESMLKKCRTHIRGVFELAVEDECIAKNPARKLVLPIAKDPSERFLLIEECRKLLAVAQGRDRLILWTFLVLGLRPSELFALRVNDVLSGSIRVDEAVVLGKLGRTKTKEAKASIPLPPQLEHALLDYIRRCGLRADDFVFASEAGTPMQQDNYLDRVLKPLGVEAGIDVFIDADGSKNSRLNHQALRRTTGTHFQKHGQVKDTQTMLRHANPETTLKHYQKRLEESTIAGVASWETELLSGLADTPKPPSRVIPFEKKKTG